MELNYSNWEVDPYKGIAPHESGAVIRFVGHPDSDNFEGNLHDFPRDLSALEKARLLRHGFEAYRQAYLKERGPYRQVMGRRPSKREDTDSSPGLLRT